MNRLTRSTSVGIPSPTVFAPTIESDSQVSKHRAVVAVCRELMDRHPEQDTVKTHPIYPGAYDGIAYTRDKYHRMEHTPAGGGRYHVRTGQILPQLTVVQVPDGRSTGRSCRNSPTFADPSSELDPRPTCDHPGASTPSGVCLSSKPPSDPAQTNVAGASWMLASGADALPAPPGTDPWSPDQVCNQTSRNGRYDSFSFHATHLFRRISRDTMDTDSPNTTAICRTDHPASTLFSIWICSTSRHIIAMYTHRSATLDSVNMKITKCCASTLNTGTLLASCCILRI